MTMYKFSGLSEYFRSFGIKLFTILCVVACAIIPVHVHAQGPSGSFVNGIVCINVSATSTSATIDFYNESGNKVTSVSNQSFAPLSPWSLFMPNIGGLGEDFIGSAVVTAGQAMRCSTNTQSAPGSGVNRVSSHPAISSSSTGTKAYVTQILNNVANFNSYVVLQNISNAASNIRASYYDNEGKLVTTTTTSIPARSSHRFYQDDGTLPSGFIGSAVFEAMNGTSAIGGNVYIYNTATAQWLSINTVKEGSAKVFLPRLVKNLSGVGYTSGWACQNIGTASIDMEMAVVMVDQESNRTINSTLVKETVGVGQSWIGYLGSSTGTALDTITRGLGNAVVTTTDGEIACTVNEDNRTTFAGQGAAYNGVPDGEQTDTLVLPQVVALGENSYRGGFQILNTTATPTTCTYTFSNGDVVTNQALPASGSNSVFAENILTNNRTSFNGSASIECGQPIVGLYNLSILGAAASGDPFTTNNAVSVDAAVISAESGNTTLYLPDINR